MTTKTKSTARRDLAFGAAILTVVFSMMLWKSWRRWPGLIVDYGPQLYMPWQISEGAVMYRDFHYMVGGPLSQHFHALLFKIFGASFTTVAVSNLFLIVLLTGLVYFCFYKCSDQLTAVTAGMSLLIVFAFANYTTMGIFNYITPYCAEVVHGVILSAAATVMLARWVQRGDARFAAAAGLGAGMILLTKPDLFLAVLVAHCAAIILFWRIHNRAQLARSLGCMIAAGILPGLAFLGWFLCHEDFKSSVKAVFAAWVPLLTTSAADSPFYRHYFGLDDPSMHARKILAQFMWLICLIAICSAASSRKLPLWLSGIAAALLGYRMMNIIWGENWFVCGYCLPPICLALLAGLLWRARKKGWDPPLIFATLWTVWSLAAMAKMGLFCRVWHYGFALAMPAFMAAVYFLLWELPRFLDRFSVRPLLFQFLVWAMLFTMLMRALQASLVIYSDKTLPVSSGGDLIYGFDIHFRQSDKTFVEALQWVESNAPPRATMAVLPQGAMMNYLSRLPNPSGYVAWNPPEVAAFGQENMTRALTNSNPSFVVEIAVNYSEYEMGYFGTTNKLGLDAQKWIEANYDLAKSLGHDWIKDNSFGIKIYRRKNSLHDGAGGALGQLPARLDFADGAHL